MNRVAVLGLSADPITLAHERLATLAWETGKFTKIWFLPCYAHQFGKVLASIEDRLYMCQLVVNELGPAYLASCYEIAGHHTGSTYETMCNLRRDMKDTEFSLIIGMDNAAKIEHWRDFEKLKREFQFVVVPRVGYNFPKGRPEVWYHQPPHIFIPSGYPTECSSTAVRTMISNNDSWESFVRPSVADWIKRHGLYGYREPI